MSSVTEVIEADLEADADLWPKRGLKLLLVGMARMLAPAVLILGAGPEAPFFAAAAAS